jgi:hypothetical protein
MDATSLELLRPSCFLPIVTETDFATDIMLRNVRILPCNRTSVAFALSVRRTHFEAQCDVLKHVFVSGIYYTIVTSHGSSLC